MPNANTLTRRLLISWFSVSLHIRIPVIDYCHFCSHMEFPEYRFAGRTGLLRSLAWIPKCVTDTDMTTPVHSLLIYEYKWRRQIMQPCISSLISSVPLRAASYQVFLNHSPRYHREGLPEANTQRTERVWMHGRIIAVPGAPREIRKRRWKLIASRTDRPL